MTLKGELPRSVGVQNATGEERRNSSRKNEGIKKLIQRRNMSAESNTTL